MTMLGRPEWGYSWSPRFVLAADIIFGLGYEETNDEYDWVPITEMYDRYEEVWQDRPRGVQSPTLLARQEFGELLGHVMLGTRCSRRFNRKNTRGFAGIKGPGSLRSRKRPDSRFSMEFLESLVHD